MSAGRTGATAGSGSTTALQLEDVSVRYGATTALADCSLSVERGECLALLGPSGSGKSTALNAIAGFVRPSSGRVYIDGQDMTRRGPADRGLGVVLQSYALFPHMSVADNIGFGLAARKRPKREISERVAEVAELVGMTSYLDRRPTALSGGQQQRVALARALAIRPAVMLLDEPLSALDARLRQDMLHELQELRTELPDVAMVYVTHDQAEALALADRIALMSDARCQVQGRTAELYRMPTTSFAATFLGGADVLEARVVDLVSSGDVEVEIGGRRVVARGPASSPGSERLVAVRPWSWRLHEPDAPVDGFTGTVTGIQWRGAVHRVTVDVPGLGATLGVDHPDAAPPVRTGQEVLVSCPAGAPVLLEERPAARGSVRAEVRS